MAAHHFVSKLHLRQFCDPSSSGERDPWLWVGNISDGSIKRRAPKNIGTVPDLFAGPGGFEEPGKTIEKFLADEVEGPAARVLRALISGNGFSGVPPELGRYLAWAAARALPVQRLEREWALQLGGRLDSELVEPPPPGLLKTKDRDRPVRLVHRVLGVTLAESTQEVESLLDAGWIPDSEESSNFLEGVHIQAYYFQARWFPRLNWFTLRPPSGHSFILGDRPVGWGVPDDLEAPPSCLRDPAAFLIAPLAPTLALVARNDRSPWEIAPEQVNAILAAWSHDWVVGADARVVERALRDRQDVSGPPNMPYMDSSRPRSKKTKQSKPRR